MSNEPGISVYYYQISNLEDFYTTRANEEVLEVLLDTSEDRVVLAPEEYVCTDALAVKAYKEILKGTAEKPVKIGLVTGRGNTSALFPAVWRLAGSTGGVELVSRRDRFTVKRDGKVVAEVEYKTLRDKTKGSGDFTLVLAENPTEQARLSDSLPAFLTIEELRERGFDADVTIVVLNRVGKLTEAPDVVLGTAEEYRPKDRGRRNGR